MSNYTDFSELGYQVIRELGHNREGGRITYLATAHNLNQQVVIKEFRFANPEGDWSGFKAYQREIEVLQQLEHPRIPQYLNSLETPQGFCLVQEYKNAPSLGERYNFNFEEIRQIALSVLEILVYLQQRTPPIIHRDIKPENILIDEQLNAYLVDFGLARTRGGEVAISSVAAGTPGFIPPEEQFGRPLTEASDLYSLGATLLSLLTGTRSVEIGKLMDDNYRFDCQKLVPQLNRRFVEWLTKIVEPNLKNRYANAAIALEALKQIYVQGDSTRLGTLLDAIKLRRPVFVLSLAALGIVALWEIIFINYQQDTQVRHLLTTKMCVGCDFHKANLEGANLVGANLRNANLRGINLGAADLRNANLESANLESADLRDTNLWAVQLKGANLGGADLRNANLQKANMVGANLVGANLVGANLGAADLEGSNLLGVYLEGANLVSAKLIGAKLVGAELEYANLKGAILRGAKLEGAKLDGAILKGAIMPDGTVHD